MHQGLPGACLIATAESRALAAAVAVAAGLPLVPLEERRFEAGEFKLRPLQPLRGRQVFVVQSLAGSDDCSAAERLLRLQFLLRLVRDQGARQLVAVVPYLAFARKDRRTQPRDPVSSRYAAEFIEYAGADGVIGLDPHNPAAFDNAFRVPALALSALPMLAHRFAALAGDAPLSVVSPDVGGIKRAQLLREQLARRLGREVGLAFIEKRRAGGQMATGLLAGEISGRLAVMIDDLCATGGTLLHAAQACRAAGARAVHAAVTHVPLPQGLANVLDTGHFDGVTVTDSTGLSLPAGGSGAACPLTALPVAPLFAAAVRRLCSDRPVTPLLEQWPVDDGD